MDIHDSLAAALDRIPAFPQSCQRMMEIGADSQNETRDMVAVISRDPVLALKILRVVNSAYFGLAREVGSVEHAVLVLGPNTVRNMVLAFAAIGMMPPRIGTGFDSNRFLLHSLTTAAMARRLAQHFGDTVRLDAYTAGLLHDFGNVLFAWSLGQTYSATIEQAQRDGASLHLAESAAFGTNHAQAGAMLALKWDFPKQLVACIGEHHDVVLNHGVARCLFLADQLAKHLGAGVVSNAPVEPLPADLAPDLGPAYVEILATLPQLETALAEAQSLLAASR